MTRAQLVRSALVVLLGLQGAFLVSVAFAVHRFFATTDGAGDPGGTGGSILVVPSPLVVLTALAGIVFGCAAIGAWLRLRESPVLRRTSTAALALSAVPNLVVLVIAVPDGVWLAIGVAGLNLALLCAELRTPSRAPTSLDPATIVR